MYVNDFLCLRKPTFSHSWNCSFPHAKRSTSCATTHDLSCLLCYILYFCPWQMSSPLFVSTFLMIESPVNTRAFLTFHCDTTSAKLFPTASLVYTLLLQNLPPFSSINNLYYLITCQSRSILESIRCEFRKIIIVLQLLPGVAIRLKSV